MLPEIGVLSAVVWTAVGTCARKRAILYPS